MHALFGIRCVMFSSEQRSCGTVNAASVQVVAPQRANVRPQPHALQLLLSKFKQLHHQSKEAARAKLHVLDLALVTGSMSTPAQCYAMLTRKMVSRFRFQIVVLSDMSCCESCVRLSIADHLQCTR
jgi:hypothetical protein